MKHLFLVLVFLVAGFAGGSLGTYAVLAHERARPSQVIRAQRFELVNETAQTRSFWGIDETKDVVLAFAVEGTPAGSRNLLINRPYDQRTTIGVRSDGSPFLRFTGTDRGLRVLLDLDDFERPSLMMSDGRLLGLTLGSVRSDTPAIRDKTERWALNFLPEETTRVGIFTQQEGSQTYIHGFSFVNPSKVKSPF